MTPTPEPAPKPYDVWKIPRRILIPAGILVVLVALAYLEENIRGKHAWMKYRHDLEVKGEKLEFKDYIPPPVPDDENFAKTPLLAGLPKYNLDPRSGKANVHDSNAVVQAMIVPLEKMPTWPPTWDMGEMTDFARVAMYLQGKMHPDSSLTATEAAAQVLDNLKEYQIPMDEYKLASRRQFSRFNSDYIIGAQAPHLWVLLNVAWVFQLRASAELALGQTTESLSDIDMVFYVSDACKSGTLGSYNQRIELFLYALQPVWEGLAQHKWSDAQLVQLQKRMEKYDLLRDYGHAMRANRAFSLDVVDGLRTGRLTYVDSTSEYQSSGRFQKWMPGGWYYQNAVRLCQIYEEVLIPAIDVAAHRVQRRSIPAQADLEAKAGQGFYYYRFFAERQLPNLQFVSRLCGSTQSYLEQATVACALERFRLKYGKLPEALDALKPEFIETIPHDIINGQPLVYRRKDESHFLLYSVGWNEKDDGGTLALIGPKKDLRLDFYDGDWVWPEYPAK